MCLHASNQGTLLAEHATSEVAGCERTPWNSLASSTGEARASSLWGTTACPSSSMPAMDVVATAPCSVGRASATPEEQAHVFGEPHACPFSSRPAMEVVATAPAQHRGEVSQTAQMTRLNSHTGYTTRCMHPTHPLTIARLALC